MLKNRKSTISAPLKYIIRGKNTSDLKNGWKIALSCHIKANVVDAKRWTIQLTENDKRGILKNGSLSFFIILYSSTIVKQIKSVSYIKHLNHKTKSVGITIIFESNKRVHR